MSKQHHSRVKKSGLPPGTLVHIGERKQERMRIQCIMYNETTCVEHDIESVDALCNLQFTDYQGWINIDGLHDAAGMERIGMHFQLDPLTLEDIMNTSSRPKLEEYEHYVLLLLKDVYYNPDASIQSEQISFILKDKVLITFQELEGDVFEGIRNRIRTASTKIRQRGVDYLAYALVDSIVDNYFLVTEQFDRELEALEEELVYRSHPRQVNQIQSVKRRYNMLKRAVLPLREVVYAMHKTENALFKKKTHLFIRDLYDHIIQVNDAMEQARETVSGLMGIYVSGTNATMNAIMKTLTIVSTIFMALSLIAGIYGMNFKHMPELEWPYGYFMALGLMAAVTLVLILYFLRKRWL